VTARQQWIVAWISIGILAVLAVIFTSGCDTARVTFDSCDEAREAGAPLPLHQGDVGWNSKLDRDGDGSAC